mmetsp:Transcript_28984/g.63812  ORF Transcript_28984/g.63812 Transcript_28984/m.63812 type:complete len:261 (+) Transcript_28984:32-814(+)
MFEARLQQGVLLKRVVDAIKDLCKDVNFDCDDSGLSLQAMDSAHVSLVSFQLKASAFQHFKCDRPRSLGIAVETLAKIFKICGSEDFVTMKAEDEGDVLLFTFEDTKSDKMSDFELKLMDIESEHLGIPEQEYKCTIKMPSSELQKVLRDLSQFGETIAISVTKEGIRFSVQGDTGTANVLLKQRTNTDKPDEQIKIQMTEAVELSFALRYLNLFAKATPLCDQVTMRISPDVPLTVEYGLGSEDSGHLRFYLAPKIDDA